MSMRVQQYPWPTGVLMMDHERNLFVVVVGPPHAANVDVNFALEIPLPS